MRDAGCGRPSGSLRCFAAPVYAGLRGTVAAGSLCASTCPAALRTRRALLPPYVSPEATASVACARGIATTDRQRGWRGKGGATTRAYTLYLPSSPAPRTQASRSSNAAAATPAAAAAAAGRAVPIPAVGSARASENVCETRTPAGSQPRAVA